MTANEIYRSVLALMFMDDNDAAEYQKNFLVQLNMKLEECFETNNSVRIAKGKEAMEEPTRSVIPLGIAGDLYVDDDETGISNDYRERYLAWKASRVRARFCPAEV